MISFHRLNHASDSSRPLQNAFLRASIPTGLPEPEFMAIDATAIETWARRKVSGAFDKDAEYGYRTATYANGSSKFFGHRAIASATCFHKDSPFNKFHLINGQILTSNVGYEPTPTLELLDNHILPHAATTPTLLVDRGFSDSVEQNWAHRLRRRNINQFFDLKITDIKEVDPVTKKPLPDTPKTTIDDNTGAIMFAGWPFVPWTPTELFNLTRPSQFSLGNEPGKKASATEWKRYAERKQAVETFEQQIEALAPYALVPNGRPSANGSWRFFTVFAPAPPANWDYGEKDKHGRLAKIYRQETITIPAAAFGKHRQGYRWGTKEWTKIYARRTAVEGIFGNLKQSSGENIKRDNFRLVGRTAISLLHTLAMVHYNLRRITKWAQQNALKVENVYATTSEEALLALLQAETDPAEANAPPAAA